MAYWLVKSEPSVYSWQRMMEDRQTRWDGVRNHQAAGHLKNMRIGQSAFFYHSGADPAIWGVVEIMRAAYPDPSDPAGRFVAVDVKAVAGLRQSVPLAVIKSSEELSDMTLVRQSRLSVQPVGEEQWHRVVALGGGLTAL